MGKSHTTYLALLSLLQDAYGATTGSGAPPPARVTIVASAAFLAGTPGAAPAQMRTGSQLRHLSAAALRRKTCDGLVAAVSSSTRADGRSGPRGRTGTPLTGSDAP